MNLQKAAIASNCDPRDPLFMGKGGDDVAVREALRRFMKARGLKPFPWTKSAGMPSSTLYQFLSGRTRSMTQQNLQRLASAAGTDLTTMLGLDSRWTPAQQRAAEIAGRLNEDDIETWLQVGTRMSEHRPGLSENQRPFRGRRRARRSS